MVAITINGYGSDAGLSSRYSVPNGAPAYVDAGNLNDAILGGSQNDYLIGGDDQDNIYAGDGNDVVLGDATWNAEPIFFLGNIFGAKADFIRGDEGNDVIFTGGGTNFADGGAGSDFVWGGNAADYLLGNTGNDTISGRGGDDFLAGGTSSTAQMNAAVLSYFGNGVDYTHNGVTGANSGGNSASNPDTEAQTGTGNDYLDGGTGNDAIYGQDGNDSLFGGDGVDFMSGDIGADQIFGEAGADTIWAGGDNDFIVGEAGNDEVYGRDGNDVLSGAAGNDYMVGGIGFDLQYGGDGNDVFLVTRIDQEDIIFGEAGTDTVNFADRTQAEVTFRGFTGSYYQVFFADGHYSSMLTVEWIAFADGSIFIG